MGGATVRRQGGAVLAVVPDLRPAPVTSDAGRVPARVGRGPVAGRRPRPALRLTRRGRVVLRLAVGVCLLAVVVVAVLVGGGAARAGHEQGALPVRHHVVLPGETLWVIAGRVDPVGDRRDTVARIVELNALRGSDLQAGQHLRLPLR